MVHEQSRETKFFCSVQLKSIERTKIFISLFPGANVINLFTTVIYCHSMAILSFFVAKHYYYVKYHRMTVNYPGKKFYNIGPRIQCDKTSLSLIKYCSNLLQYFNPRISWVKITMVIYRGIVL
jgi:hypothetical protein